MKNHPAPAYYLLFFLFIGLVSCEIDPDLADPLDTGLFVTFDNSDGLAGNQVRDIFRDSRGHLWFACYGNGVTRYDGSTFTTYNSSNSGLGDDRVTCIAEDGDGDIWFGTVSGLYFLVDQTDWYYYSLNETVDVRVNTIYKDWDDLVWIGTEGDGLYLYEEGYFYGPYQFGEWPDMNYINDICQDQSGSLWIGTDLAAARYNGEYWEFYPANEEYPDINALHLDAKGRLWAGVSGGYFIHYYAGEGFTSLNPFHGQGNIFINDITSDLSGNIWFATTLDGILQYDGVQMHTHKPYNGFPSEDNFCVETDDKGNVWIGTFEMGAIKYIPPVSY